MSAPSSANGEDTLSVTLTVRPGADPLMTARLISQVADGTVWKTTFILANTASQPANFTLSFRKQDGASMTLPLGSDGERSEISGQIAGNGSRTLQTTAVSNSLSQGVAELTGANSIGGTAIFRQRVPGRPDSEAAAPAVSVVSPRLLLPFDNTRNFSTGVALANANKVQDTSVTARFWDADGTPISTETIVLTKGGQTAFAMPVQYLALKDKRGVAEFVSSNADLAGLGLRFSPNGTFTSFEPLLPAAPIASATRQIASQVADGSGWKTTFIVVNTGTVAASYVLRCWQQMTGNALSLPFGVLGARSEITGTIPVNGAAFIETDGTAAQLAQGWAELTSSQAVGGSVVFLQRVSGRPDSEAAVPFVPVTTAVQPIIIPFDNTDGFVTSVAVVNSESRTATLNIMLREENGQSTPVDTLVLPPRQQRAFELTKYPDARGKRGTFEFSDPGGNLFGLGLRFSPPPLSTFTSLPALRR